MARGRLISKSLGSSRKFHHALVAGNGLGEFAQLLFPLLVASSDDFGRLAGDAFTVKHAVLPTSPRSEEEFELALRTLSGVGLIERYQTPDGRITLQVQQFDAHQPNLHKRTESQFPESPGNSGKLPELPEQSKRTESKGTEVRTGVKNTPVVARAKSDAPDPRVKAFLTWFQEEYKTRRNGAAYLVNWPKDAPLVKRLLTIHAVPELQDLARILLTSDEPWIEETDRSIGILSVKINWLSDRYAAWKSRRPREATA